MNFMLKKNILAMKEINAQEWIYKCYWWERKRFNMVSSDKKEVENNDIFGKEVKGYP